MSKHTPGPWKVDEHLVIRSASVNQTIADVRVFNDGSEYDASLIAAAPELLEALKQLAAFAETEQWAKSLFRQYPMFRDAIAKAEGK